MQILRITGHGYFRFSHLVADSLVFFFNLDHLGTGGFQDEFLVFLLAPVAFFIFLLFNSFLPPRLPSLRTRASFLSSLIFLFNPLSLLFFPCLFPFLSERNWVDRERGRRERRRCHE